MTDARRRRCRSTRASTSLASSGASTCVGHRARPWSRRTTSCPSPSPPCPSPRHSRPQTPAPSSPSTCPPRVAPRLASRRTRPRTRCPPETRTARPSPPRRPSRTRARRTASPRRPAQVSPLFPCLSARAEPGIYLGALVFFCLLTFPLLPRSSPLASSCRLFAGAWRVKSRG